jgi:hypothetical protein
MLSKTFCNCWNRCNITYNSKFCIIFFIITKYFTVLFRCSTIFLNSSFVFYCTLILDDINEQMFINSWILYSIICLYSRDRILYTYTNWYILNPLFYAHAKGVDNVAETLLFLCVYTSDISVFIISIGLFASIKSDFV